MTYEEYLASVKSIKKPATDTYKPIKQFSKEAWEQISGTANGVIDAYKGIIDAYKQLGITVYRDTAGKVIGYFKDIDTYTGQSGSDSGDYSNSNNAPSSSHNSRKLQVPYDVKVETDSNGNVNVLGRLLPFGQLGLDSLLNISGINTGINNLALNTYLGTIGCSVSGFLGYNIRNELYKNNPDIFGGIDPQKIDYNDYYPISVPLPEGGSLNVGKFFNLLMGTNPDTGESTMYLRDDDLAAIALKLWEMGFLSAKNKWEYPSKELKKGDLLTLPPNKTYTMQEIADLITSIVGVKVNYVPELNRNKPATDTIKFAALTGAFNIADNPSGYYSQLWGMQAGNGQYSSYRIGEYFGSIGNPPSFYYVVDGYGNTSGSQISAYGESIRVHYSEGVGYYLEAGGSGSNWGNIYYGSDFYYGYKKERESNRLCIYFNTLDAVLGAHYATGVTKQPDSVLPNFSNINISGSTPIQDTKNYINELYPDIYKNRITIPVNQPDGTTKEIIYYPVPIPVLPDATSDSSDNINAVSGNSNQTNITNITNIFPESHSIPTIVDPEPPSIDTGTGIVPPIILPTGSADAMFTAYNPTLQQVQSFGAWLWSGNPIEQIKKLFFNPIDAIISLHKVYISPVANNEGTIHLGYLDSNVPSKILTNQSNMFNFGIISLPEYFGNVFDYDPFTEVSIYLPFVGIVPLNVKDIMRSSLQVIYQCDMYTGNIMAQVNVLRDGNNGGTLYTYPGNCAEHFPVSAGDISGTISSSLNIGMGLSQTISGNPAFGISQFARGVFSPKGSTQRSGDFSGNVGSLGNRSAYLIISRPQVMLADRFPAYQGKPTNYTTTVGACSGFIKCKVDHIENVNATDSELAEIDTLLQQGILV